MNDSRKETTFEIRDSKCFISLNDGLWQQIGQKSQKHAELMSMLDSADLSGYGFMMNRVPIEIYERLMDEANKVCELLWNIPDLISVLGENREGRKPRGGVEIFKKEVVERKVHYQLKDDDYEIYQALFNRTPSNGYMDDWFPVWIAACICIFENKIYDALNQGADLVELEDEQNSVISKIVRPLDELLKFEVRESKKACKQLEQAQKGGAKSQRTSVMKSALADLQSQCGESVIAAIKASDLPQAQVVAEILKSQNIVDDYLVDEYIDFSYDEAAKAWSTFVKEVSTTFSKKSGK